MEKYTFCVIKPFQKCKTFSSVLKEVESDGGITIDRARYSRIRFTISGWLCFFITNQIFCCFIRPLSLVIKEFQSSKLYFWFLLFPGLLQWLKEQQFLLNFVRRWPHSGQPEQLALLAPLLGGALGGEYNHPVKLPCSTFQGCHIKCNSSFFFKLRIFGSNSDNNIEAAAGHPPQEENNRQQQLVNRRHRRQRQAVVAAAAAGPVNRGHNNVALALHPRNNNQQEPQQAPERQQRRRWMANGQHSTWFQGQLSLLFS
jgi:hypothetical protein